ncbi:MAG TPA: hypothetical protein VI895_14390, partial [Bdellovibrionota bacterium]|nr:hypothetical protein [Bdellovibrionota bacterium]
MKTKVIALFISLTWMAGGSSARASEGPSPRKIEGGVGSAAAILFEALRENRRLEKNGVKVVLTETTSTGIEEITKVSTATRREDQVRCERKKVSTRKPRDNFDVLSHAGRPENYDRQISYRCLFWLSSSKIISPGGVDQLAPVLF